jgi:adenylate isopentenyltransferase (cytokinin synthase)
VEEIKSNTRRLSCRQHQKIQRLAKLWRVGRVDATEAFRARGHAADEAWERLVAAPCIAAVRDFLYDDLTAPTVPLFAPAAAVV